jgi:DNA-binding XRE family transcriptional regulator
MNKNKAAKLRRHGWEIGNAADFLNLSSEEAAYVELKVTLAQYLHEKRKSRHLTQEQLAQLIHSSQSRVAKMEKNDPTVSIDLMVKSLLAMGATRRELAEAIG